MKYQIHCVYDTGDTFGHEEGCISVLDCEWNKQEVVDRNIKRIEDHYKIRMYLEREYDISKKQKEAAIKKALKQDWHICYSHGNTYNPYTIRLEKDDGTFYDQSVCWTGYFDSLVGCDVVETINSGLAKGSSAAGHKINYDEER